MEPSDLKEKLVNIIKQIQVDSDLECPELTGQTRPVGGVPQFDSKIWPVATSILATEINVTIPNDVNLFFDETTKSPRSIDQIVAFVCELISKKEKKTEKAA